MIEFMKSHYYDPYVAQYVHPKKEYKVKNNSPVKNKINVLVNKTRTAIIPQVITTDSGTGIPPKIGILNTTLGPFIFYPPFFVLYLFSTCC